MDGMNDELISTEYGIVMGNEVKEDGSMSARLKARCDKGAQLLEQGILKRIVVTGGIDAHGNNEAEVMKAYLVSSGIDKDLIEVDSTGANTFQSFWP